MRFKKLERIFFVRNFAVGLQRHTLSPGQRKLASSIQQNIIH